MRLLAQSCVTSVCETALSAGTNSADIILNLVSRDQEPETAEPINTPMGRCLLSMARDGGKVCHIGASIN